MTEVIRFALLGLGVGALYAFASQGLIVIYRGTGVLNFSLGATAIAGVFMQWELQNEHGWPFLASAIVGVAWSGFLGALTHWVIMRPLRRASSLVRVIATLGVLITIQAAVVIRYGSNPRQVESWLPTDRVTLWGDVGITVDRLILLGIGSASALASVDALPIEPVRPRHRGGVGERAFGSRDRTVAQPDRAAELGVGVGDRRRRRDPRRPHHHPAGHGDDGAHPGRARRGVGRRLSILSHRHGSRVRDRYRPGAGRTVWQSGGPRTIAPVPGDHRRPRVPRPVAAAARPLPAEAADRRKRSDLLGLDVVRLRCRRLRDGHQGDEVDRRHHRVVGGGDRAVVDRGADRDTPASSPSRSTRSPASARTSPGAWSPCSTSRSCSGCWPASPPRCRSG